MRYAAIVISAPSTELTFTAKLLIETQKWLAQKASPEPYENLSEDVDEKTTEIVVKFV